MNQGWSCPQCGLILAPHVSEHRCGPPPGITVTQPGTGPCNPWPATITLRPPEITSIQSYNTCATTTATTTAVTAAASYGL